MKLRTGIIGLVAAAAGVAGCGDDKDDAGSKNAFQGVKDRGTLRAGIRSEAPPHSFVGPGGRLMGFDVEIAQELAKNLGVKLEIVRVDELTRISFLKNGRIDVAVAAMNHTRERDKEIDFSQTYFFAKQSFLTKKGGPATLKELGGKTVGMTRGSSAIGNWRDYSKANGLPAPKIVELGDARAAVEAVKSGKIEGWAEDLEQLQNFVADDPSLAAITAEGIGPKLDGVGIKENESELADAVNIALQEIETSGRYDAIYDKWFGPRSRTPVPRGGSIEVWANG
ncbi:MAG: transporter substrate-binding domain-containing protein [Solirubrobacteraceae bacterium]